MQALIENLLEGESKFIEYKVQYTKSLLKTVSAFSNYHDGIIVIGIADDGRIPGVGDPETARLGIENSIKDNVTPCPDYEVETKLIEGKPVLVFRIHKGIQTPYITNGRAYKRIDTSTMPVAKYEYDELVLLGRNLTFEELEYFGGDLAFSRLEELLKDRLGIEDVNDDVLRSLGLFNEGKFNNAAALLADANDFNEGGMDIVVYADESMLNIKDRVSLGSESVINYLEAAMTMYGKHLSKGDVIKGIYRESFDEIPEEAFREAIINAIVHRDYNRGGSSKIEFFDNRVEITSIGGLPVGITKEEYISGAFSNIRNKIMADIFFRCRLMEKMGTGVRRIRHMYRNHGEKPVFKVFENSIQVILPRQSISGRVSDSHSGSLSPEEEKLLNYIKASGTLKRLEVEKYMGVKKTKATKLLNSLLDKHSIIKVGSGKDIVYKIYG